jgi:hypothetical protein
MGVPKYSEFMIVKNPEICVLRKSKIIVVS